MRRELLLRSHSVGETSMGFVHVGQWVSFVNSDLTYPFYMIITGR